MTLGHGGILFIILGTICLAFAVKIENKYTLSARNKKDKKYWKNIVKNAEDGTYYEPTVVYIDQMLFRIGLACVAIGSLMQW
ncbi:MAG: hypothetical protein JRJ43_07905 [Deltaproteobacteria bacterium]|nr:hypothetical protein [Deltaproteobacteria bacterium]MBW1719473.1 hypothetical protein [Deltaproteobacteria bacterium]MBW2081339.1 hypothetical protein [Deltaproteobacteria bacterium]